MTKAIFWDFDGTLVYADRRWTIWLHSALTDLNHDIDIEVLRQHMRKGYSWRRPEVSYTDSTGQKWWDAFLDHMNSFYEKFAVPKADAIKAQSYLFEMILNPANYLLYKDAQAALTKCAEMGYKNYILSNHIPEIPRIIKELGLSGYFVDYIVSANIGYEKPRIEIFTHAIKLAGFPDLCYMVGDNPVADMQGGRAAGMKTVLVHNDGDFESDYKCESLCEIPLILQK